MKQFLSALGLALSVAACSNSQALEIPKGSDVTVQKKDGVQVAGRLVEVESKQVVLEDREGRKIQVPRTDIETVKATPREPAASDSAAVATSGSRDAFANAPKDEPKPAPAPEFREISVPAGTVLPIELTTAVASDTSRVEDQVRGTIRRDVTVDGVEVIPAGSTVLGHVTSAVRPGKVKGRGSVGFRFNTIDLPGPGERLDISTGTISRLAPATKKQDAAKIGGGAAGGAIIGGILGGGDGAAKGAAIGGGAGTAVVLSTRGKDVRVPAGTQLSVKLTAPLTVRVPMK